MEKVIKTKKVGNPKIHRKKIKYSGEKKKKIKGNYSPAVHKHLDKKAKGIKKKNTKEFNRSVMKLGSELRKLESFLKILDKKLLRRLRSVKEENQLDLAKYLVIAKLKEIHLTLLHEFGESVRDYAKDGSHYDFIRHKLGQLPSKIHIFETDFDKEEFKKLINFIDKLRKEVKDV